MPIVSGASGLELQPVFRREFPIGTTPRERRFQMRHSQWIGTLRAAVITVAVFVSIDCTDGYDWSGHNDFAYQLQNYRFDEIRDSGFSLFVVDASLVEDSARRIEELREAFPGERKILCYLSIGEAEDYRTYWQPEWGSSPPDFLEEENRRWKGNYKVRYWQSEWQDIVFGSPESMLDEILALGFDGVYLDIVDAYQYFEEKGRAGAAREMVDFVLSLARYARQRKPGFGVFPQNAEELGILFPEYLDALDGIGVEDLFYGNPRPGRASPREWTEERINALVQWRDAGKLVLTVDYTRGSGQTRDAYERSRELGFIPYATVLSLGKLRVNGGLDPEPIRR